MDVTVGDASTFFTRLREPVRLDDPSFSYIDKLATGFLVWRDSVKGYRPVGSNDLPFAWEATSQPLLQAMREVVAGGSFFSQLAVLLGQESSKNPTTLKLRSDNTTFVKSLGSFTITSHQVTPILTGYV